MKDRSAIVLAVDDDHPEGGAVRFTAEEAQLTGRPVTVVHVVHGSTHVTGPNPLSFTYAEVEKRGRQVTDGVADRLRELTEGTVDVRCETTRGRTVDQLVAISEHARLVVVERRPMSAAGHLAVRSTSTALGARSLAPLVSVPAAWRPTDPFVRRVVLGASERDEAWGLFGHAFRLAAEHHVGLHVVRSVDLPELEATPGADLLSSRRAGVRADLERELQPFRNRYPGVQVDIEIPDGPASHALRQTTGRHDLLVVGRRDQPHPVYERLGPVPRSMLRTAACPVLVVPHPFGDPGKEASCSASASTGVVGRGR